MQRLEVVVKYPSVLYKATMIKTTNTVKALAVISSCLGIVMKIKKNTDSSQIVTGFVQLPTQPALISGLFSLMYQ